MARPENLHDGMAPNEIADPHVGNEQDRPNLLWAISLHGKR
jgi:hypothetical protein